MKKGKGRKGVGAGHTARDRPREGREEAVFGTGNLAKRVSLKGSQHTHDYARGQIP